MFCKNCGCKIQEGDVFSFAVNMEIQSSMLTIGRAFNTIK